LNDLKKRQKNELLDQLNVERQNRAREVLNELTIRGIKKIGREKISDLEVKEEDLDYDQIMDFYQTVLRKEREQFEVIKNKKMNDVEIWTRARKEEELSVMKKYCEEHGKEDLEHIQKAIEERHAKEVNVKMQLQSAKAAFTSFRQQMMEKRRALHKEQQI